MDDLDQQLLALQMTGAAFDRALAGLPDGPCKATAIAWSQQTQIKAHEALGLAYTPPIEHGPACGPLPT